MAALNNDVPQPACYQFNPTDQELLKDYLVNMAHGNPRRPTDNVFNLDVYDDRIDGDPVYGDHEYWRELFKLFDDEDTLYFFTRLKPKSDHDTRIRRDAVNGTWKNQHRPIDIYDNGSPIGSKSNFSYIPNMDFSEPSGNNWVMHEYRLIGQYIDNLDVLWKITKKKGRNGMTADNVPSDEELSQKMMDLENALRGDGQI